MQWDLEKVSGAVWAVCGFELSFSHPKAEFFETAFRIGRSGLATSDHPLPERKRNSLRISIPEPRLMLLIEYFPTDYHLSSMPEP
jgi:hypothetical protein